MATAAVGVEAVATGVAATAEAEVAAVTTAVARVGDAAVAALCGVMEGDAETGTAVVGLLCDCDWWL